MPKHNVFLSHNSTDKAAVEIIARRLREDAKLHPFLDKWHLIPGEPWQEAIEEALAQSETVAVFVGPSGISPWHNEEMRTGLDQAVRMRDDYRVIPVLLPGASEEALTGFLARRTWVDFRPGLDNAEAFDRLVAGIKGEAVVSGVYELPGEPSPYRGLLRFEAKHRRFFFGRDVDRQRLVEKLEHHRFVAVVGASGSGKSSLVRAGLLPDLADDALPGSCEWHTLVFTPGSQPLRSLANQLTTLAPLVADPLETADKLTQRLAEQTDGLHTATTVYLADRPRPLLLVVDQFEELFTLCQDGPERCRAQAEQFIANIADAVRRGDGQIRILVTLRADFLDRCLAFQSLRDLLEDRQVLLGPLDEPAMREAIVRPAQEVGALFEKGLVSMILRDVEAEPGALPLLQHALYELWQARRGPWLTLDAYEASGGVRGALERRAQTTYDALTPEQQNIARSILLRLTALGEGVSDTRRRVVRSELYLVDVVPAHVDAVLQALSGEQARLVIADEESVEVAHEALIQQWDTLREWLEENREALRIHRHLTQSAEGWKELARDPGELYRGARLAQAAEWADEHVGELNPLEREFLEASVILRDRQAAEEEAQRQRELKAARQLAKEAEARRQAEEERAQEAEARALEQAAAAARLRRQALTILAVALVAIVAFIVAGLQWKDARDRQRDLAAQLAENLADQAERQAASGNDVIQAFHLALRSAQLAPEGYPETPFHVARVLHIAASLPTRVVNMQELDRQLLYVVVAPDLRHLLAMTGDYTVGVWDLQTGQREALPFPADTVVGYPGDPVTGGPGWGVGSLEFSLDGRLAKALMGGDTLWIWEVDSGKSLPETQIESFSSEDTLGRYEEQLIERESHGWVTREMSPDGKTIVAVSWTGQVMFWDRTAAPLVRTIDLPEDVEPIAIRAHPAGDGILILTKDGRFMQRELDGGEVWSTSIGDRDDPPKFQQGEIWTTSESDAFVLTYGVDEDGESEGPAWLEVWRLGDQSPLKRTEFSRYRLGDLVMWPDGEGGFWEFEGEEEYDYLHRWSFAETDRGSERNVIRLTYGGITRDGRVLLEGGDREISLLELATGEPISGPFSFAERGIGGTGAMAILRQTHDLHATEAGIIATLPTGHRVELSNDRGGARLELDGQLLPGSAAEECQILSPDGRLTAGIDFYNNSGACRVGWDGSLVVREVESGRVLAGHYRFEGSHVIGFAPDGREILFRDFNGGLFGYFVHGGHSRAPDWYEELGPALTGTRLLPNLALAGLSQDEYRQVRERLRAQLESAVLADDKPAQFILSYFFREN